MPGSSGLSPSVFFIFFRVRAPPLCYMLLSQVIAFCFVFDKRGHDLGLGVFVALPQLQSSVKISASSRERLFRERFLLRLPVMSCNASGSHLPCSQLRTVWRRRCRCSLRISMRKKTLVFILTIMFSIPLFLSECSECLTCFFFRSPFLAPRGLTQSPFSVGSAIYSFSVSLGVFVAPSQLQSSVKFWASSRVWLFREIFPLRLPLMSCSASGSHLPWTQPRTVWQRRCRCSLRISLRKRLSYSFLQVNIAGRFTEIRENFRDLKVNGPEKRILIRP